MSRVPRFSACSHSFRGPEDTGECPPVQAQDTDLELSWGEAVQQELDAVLNRSEKGLAPEVYERVLHLISAEDEELQAPEAEKTLERLPEP